MSNKRDPKKIENEPQTKGTDSDELTGKELEHIVGGTGTLTPPPLPTISPTIDTMIKIDKTNLPTGGSFTP